MYKELKSLNLPAIDQEILAFWEEHEVMKKSIEQRSVDKPFVFYEGHLLRMASQVYTT